jgi:cytochrome c peroxidase
MKKVIASICVLWLAAVSFCPAGKLRFNVPKGWPAPAYDFSKNPLSKEKILLGRALFYDPGLSADSTISCVSCHLQYSGFTHIDHQLSHGIGGHIGTRNSPTLMNLAWGKLFMWDGAVNHLDMQPLAPITHKDEMGYSIDSVVLRLGRSSVYKGLFYKAYHDSAVTGAHFLKAISQFMLTLVSANSKYDKVMRKENGVNFTEQEGNGYRLFRANCAVCHQEPLFTTNDFANNGLPVDTTLNDYGRVKITHNAADSMHFKIPTLRNIEFSYPYMHDGRFGKLREVIDHYTTGIAHTPTLSPELRQPIVLSPNEKIDLVAFLITLSDREFLFNQDFEYPREVFGQ